jgi:hypothetical protein
MAIIKIAHLPCVKGVPESVLFSQGAFCYSFKSTARLGMKDIKNF